MPATVVGASLIGAVIIAVEVREPDDDLRGSPSGTRQAYILQDSEATVAVDRLMNAGLSEDFGDRALFVFTPSSGRYLIKTAKIRVNDDPANETYRLAPTSEKVIATACDAADSNQLFHVIRDGGQRLGQANLRHPHQGLRVSAGRNPRPAT